MFERNVIYKLIDVKGLQSEPLLSNTTIVADIAFMGNVIRPIEVNSFGDVHAFKYGTGAMDLTYIPREFVKYFERDEPAPVGNIIKFPRKNLSSEVKVLVDDNDHKPEIPPKSWEEIREEIKRIIGNGDCFKVIRSEIPTRLPSKVLVGGVSEGVEPPRKPVQPRPIIIDYPHLSKETVAMIQSEPHTSLRLQEKYNDFWVNARKQGEEIGWDLLNRPFIKQSHLHLEAKAC